LQWPCHRNSRQGTAAIRYFFVLSASKWRYCDGVCHGKSHLCRVIRQCGAMIWLRVGSPRPSFTLIDGRRPILQALECLDRPRKRPDKCRKSLSAHMNLPSQVATNISRMLPGWVIRYLYCSSAVSTRRWPPTLHRCRKGDPGGRECEFSATPIENLSMSGAPLTASRKQSQSMELPPRCNRFLLAGCY
jgi:hypothetical protein